jgi:hypothetical protein
MTDDGPPDEADESVDSESGSDTRRARIETVHSDSETAAALARAVRPDNTAEMTTSAEGRRVVTTIRRGTTGGLRTTVDDYVVNVGTGAQVLAGEGNRNTDTGEARNGNNTDTERPTDTPDYE